MVRAKTCVQDYASYKLAVNNPLFIYNLPILYHRYIYKKTSRLKALTHQTPLRRFGTLFFEELPFTDDASVVNGKTSKKSMQKRREVVNGKTLKKSMQKQRGGFWCVRS